MALSRFRLIDSTGCAHRISKLVPHAITHHKDIHYEKRERLTTVTFLPMKMKKLQLTNEPTFFLALFRQKQHDTRN